MSSLGLVLIAAVALSSCCLCLVWCQEEDNILSILRDNGQKVEALSRTLDDMNERLRAIEELMRPKSATTDMTTQVCTWKEQLMLFQDILSEALATDECVEGFSKCSPYASCKDLSIGYRCSCFEGFVGDGFNCTDIDECSEGLHYCDDEGKSECVNSPGSYTCTCLPGFSGDGFKCEDINECINDDDDDDTTGVCHSNAICANSMGSYSCYCSVGFAGDGLKCEDIDECKTDSHWCHPNATCTNTIGSYECTCPDPSLNCEYNADLCRYPSKAIEDLGCVTPVKQGLIWEQGRQRCQSGGGQLLQELTSLKQLYHIKQSFLGYFNPYGLAWVGQRKLEDSEDKSHQDDGKCGALLFRHTPHFYVTRCSLDYYVLCQKKRENQ